MAYITEQELKEIQTKMTENSEFEIRFGDFPVQKGKLIETPYGTKFIPNIDLEAFISSIDFMNKTDTDTMTLVYAFVVTHKDKTRVTQFLEPPTDSSLSFPWANKIVCDKVIRKHQVLRHDNHEYGLRFSLANEEPVTENVFTPENAPVYFKAMKRFSYTLPYMKVDITMFKSNNRLDDLMSSPLQYDIEIEVNKDCELKDVTQLIETFLKIINKTTIVIPKSDIENVNEDYYKLTEQRKFIGCQPATLRESRIDRIDDYALTMKLDGQRHLLLINHKGYYLIDNKMNVKCFRKQISTEVSLLDGELFEGKYYAFDILFHKGIDLRDKPFTERYKKLKELNLFIEVKEYTFEGIYNKIEEYLDDNLEMKDNTLDGFIFVSKSKSYKEAPLKWKPEKLNTIDFKINKCAFEDENYEEWDLLCYDNTNTEIPFTYNGGNLSKIYIPKALACNYINGTVVEFYYDKLYKTFIPLKTRHDKVKGNYIKVAQDNFDTIMNPYDLKNFSKETKSRNQSAFFNMRRFHNWIKRNLLEKYSIKTGNLLDLACGKGGDIYKWVDSNIRQVHGYDINPESITEAQRRFSKVISKPTSKNFDYNFEVKDLSVECVSTSTMYDTASCFFAIHYFYKDINTLKKFAESLKNVKEGGYFIMTTLSSEKLKEIDYTLNGESIEIIKKHIDPKKNLGNIISVSIKDSVLDTHTEEYIVDYDYTIRFMKSKSFKLVETKLFGEYYNDWKQNQNFLSAQECEYSFLNRVYVFVKDSSTEDNTQLSVQAQEFIPITTEKSNEELLLNRPLKGKNAWKLQELKQYCLDNQLDTKGKKEQLIERIKQMTLKQ